MSAFDAWMDFNVGLYTTNLDSYIKSLEADNVPYMGAFWKTSTGDKLYSLFVHVPATQMIIELISSTSKKLQASSTLIALEQRLSDTRLAALVDKPPKLGLLQPVKVSRAATDL